jgi:hypothetical protein
MTVSVSYLGWGTGYIDSPNLSISVVVLLLHIAT